MGTGGSFPSQVMKQTTEPHLEKTSNVLLFLQLPVNNVGKQCDQVLNTVVRRQRFMADGGLLHNGITIVITV